MKELDKKTKTEIVINLEAHLKQTKQSRNKFSNEAKVSGANITNIMTGKWGSISDSIWTKVALASGFSFESWVNAQIPNLSLVQNTCAFAQRNSSAAAISYAAGSGKTHSFKQYKNNNHNVIYIEVAFHWTRKMFFQNLAAMIGIDTTGHTASFLADLIIRKLKSMSKALLIVDEADKLTESGMLFLITLYNELDGTCGMVISGAPFLENYVDKCQEKDKRGYKEIYSRIGRRFIHLNQIKLADVRAICIANGVINEAKIQTIANDCEGDLRRVKREIIKQRDINNLINKAS